MRCAFSRQILRFYVACKWTNNVVVISWSLIFYMIMTFYIRFTFKVLVSRKPRGCSVVRVSREEDGECLLSEASSQ